MKPCLYRLIGLAALVLAANCGPYAAAAKPDILIADFEGGDYGGWTAEGAAFGSGPAKGTLESQMQVDGFKGDGLVNSFHGGDRSEGTLTSPEFTIERPYIHFLIGGGGYEDETFMELLVDGEPVRRATGNNTKPGGRERLEAASWDVAGHVGKTAVIRIVDRRTGGWGHINVDHIVQSSTAPVLPVALEASIRVNESHLVMPVANSGEPLHLGIYDGDTLVQNFRITLPAEDKPYWLASYPLSEFRLEGKTISVKPFNDELVSEAYREAFSLIQCGDGFSGEKVNDYAKPYRNQFHVSPRRGWNNDPNGLVYADGLFHMYYQHNPFGIRWGNMHWGHWSSSNLVHWIEHPIALFQRTTGDMMFSGGGFIDFNNSAGLGKGTQFAAFTSTGRGECLAYSTDGGLTFAELEENPVVEHRGRDPKIIWYEPEQKWVMAVYNAQACAETRAVPPADPNAKQTFANCAFYESKDLRSWTRTGAFTHPDRPAVFECPELFELPVEGKPEESRWIFYAAQNRFFVGHFDGKIFTADHGPAGGGRGAAYAAQTFSDVPDGRRIQVLWVRTRLHLKQHPDQITNQAMSLPHELTLRETENGLRVYCRPVEEVKALRAGIIAEGRSLTQEEAHQMLQQAAGELSEVLIEFEEPGAKALRISGIDCSFKGRSARIFTDRTFSEIYIDDGHDYTIRALGENQLGNHETFLAGGGGVKALTLYRLNPIWNN